jgi:hypothetical protein
MPRRATGPLPEKRAGFSVCVKVSLRVASALTLPYPAPRPNSFPSIDVFTTCAHSVCTTAPRSACVGRHKLGETGSVPSGLHRRKAYTQIQIATARWLPAWGFIYHNKAYEDHLLQAASCAARATMPSRQHCNLKGTVLSINHNMQDRFMVRGYLDRVPTCQGPHPQLRLLISQHPMAHPCASFCRMEHSEGHP